MNSTAHDKKHLQDGNLAFAELLETVLVLKNPNGCPWDAKQTHKSLRRYFLEEVCEVLAALDAGDLENLEEELGDVLIHILFQADIAWRNGTFDIATVMRKATDKLQRRHPHVFASKGEKAIPESEVEQNWERIKRAERGNNSILKSFPPQLSAIVSASYFQKQLAKLGLDPTEGAATDAKNAEQRAGDAMLALIWELTRADIDPESALRQSVQNLTNRIAKMEQNAGGQPLDALTTTELNQLYQDSLISD